MLPHKPLILRERVPVDFTIRIKFNHGDGAELETNFGTLARLSIFHENLWSAKHIHVGNQKSTRSGVTKEGSSTAHPVIKFGHLFRHESKYRIFVQFRHEGASYNLPFDIWIEPEVEL